MLAHILGGVTLACCAALRDVPTPELGQPPCHSPSSRVRNDGHWKRAALFHVPPVLCTFSTLSFPPSCWNALTSGAATVKTAHWPYVGELAWGPEGAGALTTFW